MSVNPARPAGPAMAVSASGPASGLASEPASVAASAPTKPAAAKPDRASWLAYPKGGLNLKRLDWTVVGGLIGLHALAALAFIPGLFTWSGLVLGAVLGFVSICLGVCLCYHRLLTHRSFKTPRWFEYVLVWCGCLAWQGGPIGWVGLHRMHHQHADTDHDPHSPRHGFTWAHMTWFLHKYHHGVHRRQAAADLLKDRGLRLLDRFAWVPVVSLIAVLLVAGWFWGETLVGEGRGWATAASWVVWAVGLRTVLFFHTTWFVNSAAHTWGYRNYEGVHDDSTNLWWLAFLSFGENWHNNHHAHPRSAAHGLRWWEVDITYGVIKAMSWVGLAKDVRVPGPEKRPWVGGE